MLALRTTTRTLANVFPRRAILRSYATPTDSQTNNPGPVTSSPPGSRASYTPFFLAGGAVLIITGYYSFSNPDPPNSPAVEAIDRAMAPKTEGANLGLRPQEGYTQRHPTPEGKADTPSA